MRELLPFLRSTGVSARSNNLPCRSMADFDKAEAERLAGQRAQDEAAARTAGEKQLSARAEAARRAQLELFSERETWLAVAGLAADAVADPEQHHHVAAVHVLAAPHSS